LNESITEIKEDKESIKEYDPMARNPSFCGADKTLAFELTPLARHFHPSVSLFAQTLLDSGCIKYDGNPLKDFTVVRFLERFVYRNAKTNNIRNDYQPQGLRAVPVNSSAYLNNEEHEIPVEEKFFYRYFKESKEKLGEPIKKEDKEEDLDSDAESVGDQEFDEIMGSYFENNGALESDEEDVDFMSNVHKKKKKGKKVSKEEMESDESQEEISAESGSEEDDDVDEFIEMDSEEEPEFDAEDGDLDDNEDDGAGLDGDIDLDFEDDPQFSNIKSRLKIPSTRKSKLKGLKSDDVFAPAEEFSEMLESNANVDFSGSHTLINTDNSNMKQLKWEANRDRWVKGFKRNQKGQGKNPPKKRKFK